jgi:CO dehydrogenase maturation factor
MRIAFCGKGGSGKTTIASLFIRYLKEKGDQILAIDGDINQHLSHSLGLPEDKLSSLTRLGHRIDVLNTYIKGSNPRIRTTAHMIESTPAGRGSNFITFEGGDVVSNTFILRDKNLRFMAVGGHEDHDVGATCYHKFTGAEGLFLNHLLDGEDEFVIGDMCAGADPFASSGLASRYDAIFLIVEPTLKSVGVFSQAKNYADPFGIRVFIIANKITSVDDLAFIEQKTEQKVLCSFGDLQIIRKMERGEPFTLDALDNTILQNLESLRKTSLSLGPRDWSKYTENGKFFHKRAGDGWASSKYGYDLMEQVDPEFSYESVVRDIQKQAA